MVIYDFIGFLHLFFEKDQNRLDKGNFMDCYSKIKNVMAWYPYVESRYYVNLKPFKASA